MESRHLYSQLNNQRGVTAVIVAICLVMLVGFIALSIDVSHILVARNELQNAADAGALSGAGNLYLNDGTAINTNANQFGYDAAVANYSDQLPVGRRASSTSACSTCAGGPASSSSSGAAARPS